MSSLPDFNRDYKKFLDRSLIIYGESGTGKSHIIIDILATLKLYVDQVIVIAPTDPTNHTYDRGVVPLPCIHYTITPKLLTDLYDRQTALCAIYSRVNNIIVLKKLFDRIRSNDLPREIINIVYEKLKNYEREIRVEETDESVINVKMKEMREECERFITLVYKKYINDNYAELSASTLPRDEQFALKYLNLNPRMVIIFDDCTDLIKKYRAHPVMQKIFYQCRHAYITAIFACHTDKVLDPELKKNAFGNIFTSVKSARTYFNRGSNDFDPEEKQVADAACRVAFTPLLKHQKLVWTRSDNTFSKLLANSQNDFSFGSDIIRSFCEKIQINSDEMNTDNKFISAFL